MATSINDLKQKCSYVSKSQESNVNLPIPEWRLSKFVSILIAETFLQLSLNSQEIKYFQSKLGPLMTSILTKAIDHKVGDIPTAPRYVIVNLKAFLLLIDNHSRLPVKQPPDTCVSSLTQKDCNFDFSGDNSLVFDVYKFWLFILLLEPSNKTDCTEEDYFTLRAHFQDSRCQSVKGWFVKPSGAQVQCRVASPSIQTATSWYWEEYYSGREL